MDQDEFEKIMETWAAHEMEAAPGLHPPQEMYRLVAAKKRKGIIAVYLRWVPVGVAVAAMIGLIVLYPDLLRPGKKELTLRLREGFAAEKGVFIRDQNGKGSKKGGPPQPMTSFKQLFFHYQKPGSRLIHGVDLRFPQPRGFALSAEDNYRLLLEPASERHVYIFQLDAAGNLFKIFPNEKYNPVQNPLRDGRIYYLPSDSRWFYLGKDPGEERIFIIISPQPMPVWEELYEEYKRGGDTTEKEKTIARFLRKIDGIREESGEGIGKYLFRFDHWSPS